MVLLLELCSDTMFRTRPVPRTFCISCSCGLFSTLQVEQCKVEEVEEKIRMLTEKHATQEEFISRKAK